MSKPASLLASYLAIFLVLLLSGCAMLRGPEAQYEGSLSCKGKVALTGNGSLSIGAGYGGSGTNAWTLQGDCGEGFTIDRHRERQKGPADPPEPTQPAPSKTVPKPEAAPNGGVAEPIRPQSSSGAPDDGRSAVEWLLKR